LIEYRKPSVATRNHGALGDYWGEWYPNDDRIQRHLFDDKGFLLATETLEGERADVQAFAIAAKGATTHDAEAARMISWRYQRQTRLLRDAI
jgi:hypothetical protein